MKKYQIQAMQFKSKDIEFPCKQQVKSDIQLADKECTSTDTPKLLANFFQKYNQDDISTLNDKNSNNSQEIDKLSIDINSVMKSQQQILKILANFQVKITSQITNLTTRIENIEDYISSSPKEQQEQSQQQPDDYIKAYQTLQFAVYHQNKQNAPQRDYNKTPKNEQNFQNQKQSQTQQKFQLTIKEFSELNKQKTTSKSYFCSPTLIKPIKKALDLSASRTKLVFDQPNNNKAFSDTRSIFSTSRQKTETNKLGFKSDIGEIKLKKAFESKLNSNGTLQYQKNNQSQIIQTKEKVE